VEERESYKRQIEELQDKCEDKQQYVDEERVKFMEFKREVGLGAVNSRSGRPIPAKVCITCVLSISGLHVNKNIHFYIKI
jgi:hypothetical protein